MNQDPEPLHPNQQSQNSDVGFDRQSLALFRVSGEEFVSIPKYAVWKILLATSWGDFGRQVLVLGSPAINSRSLRTCGVAFSEMSL